MPVLLHIIYVDISAATSKLMVTHDIWFTKWEIFTTWRLIENVYQPLAQKDSKQKNKWKAGAHIFSQRKQVFHKDEKVFWERS